MLTVIRACAKRSRFLAVTGIFLATGCYGESTPVVSSESQKQDDRPNIVFILADDLGYGQIGAYGQTKIKTPNIDSFAEEGVRFTQAYSGSAVCSPSRISLMTGRDGRSLHDNRNSMKIRESDVTFPQILQKAGYETSLVGKWGIGVTVGVNDPLKMGFDSYYGILKNTDAHRQFPDSIMRNNVPEIIEGNANNGKGAYAQQLFTEEAIEFISKKRESPFFLYLSYTTPHAELAAPDKYYRLYEDKFTETPYNGLADGTIDSIFEKFYPEPVEQPNATMAAMVTGLDDYVGQVLIAIEEAGLEKDTLVIFTSDNGPHREGGADPDFFDAAKPYSGIKRDLYDGGIHVPMIVRWPGKVSEGAVNDTPWAFSDVLPTLAELVGVPLESVPGVITDGTSIMPVLKGEQEDLPERLMYWEFVRLMEGANQRTLTQAARIGEWKAVRYGVESPVKLFNIMDDPGENNNLAAEEKDMAAKFLAIFDEQRN